MNKILKTKAIFIDLDGTTYDEVKNKHYTISDKNIATIKKINKTIPVIISTGRHIRNVFPWIKKLNLKYAVCQNGAQIINNKRELIQENKMSLKYGANIIEFAIKNKLMVKVNDAGIFYGSKFPYGFIVKNFFKFDVEKGYEFNRPKFFTKIAITGATKRIMRKYKYFLEQKYDQNLSILNSGNGYTIEITSNKATKGIGNSFVAKRLNVNPLECVHIGDSMNDSTTAKYMDLIAMKNSNIELFKFAKYIGPHYKNAGLSKVLNGYYKNI